MSRLLRIVSLALIGGYAAAPAAAAQPARTARARLGSKIVLNRSIGGIGFGLTPAQIKRRLGRPSRTIRVGGRIAQITYYKDQLSIDFDTLQRSDPAQGVSAIGPRFHTSKGIRVGSSERQVKRAYHGMRCDRFACDMYTGTPGAIGTRSTDFSFVDGKVEAIGVQIVYE